MLNWGSRSMREVMEIDREYCSENLEGRDPLLAEGWQVFSGSYRDNVVGESSRMWLRIGSRDVLVWAEEWEFGSLKGAKFHYYLGDYRFFKNVCSMELILTFRLDNYGLPRAVDTYSPEVLIFSSCGIPGFFTPQNLATELGISPTYA